jgi:hypothetical protein
MFNWLKGIRKQKQGKEKGVRGGQRKEQANFLLSGKSILKQKIETAGGTKEVYFQPVKLEVPNMVTIGSKLDTIISKLDAKPDKEWFESEYIKSLKNIMELAENRDEKETETIGKTKVEKTETKRLKLIKNLAASKIIIHALEKNKTVTISDLSEHTELSRVTLWKYLKK